MSHGLTAGLDKKPGLTRRVFLCPLFLKMFSSATVPVGAGLPAMDERAPRPSRQHASSLATIASKLAPTPATLLPRPRHAALITFVNPLGKPRRREFAGDFRALQHDPR